MASACDFGHRQAQKTPGRADEPQSNTDSFPHPTGSDRMRTCSMCQLGARRAASIRGPPPATVHRIAIARGGILTQAPSRRLCYDTPGRRDGFSISDRAVLVSGCPLPIRTASTSCVPNPDDANAALPLGGRERMPQAVRGDGVVDLGCLGRSNAASITVSTRPPRSPQPHWIAPRRARCRLPRASPAGC